MLSCMFTVSQTSMYITANSILNRPTCRRYIFEFPETTSDGRTQNPEANQNTRVQLPSRHLCCCPPGTRLWPHRLQGQSQHDLSRQQANHFITGSLKFLSSPQGVDSAHQMMSPPIFRTLPMEPKAMHLSLILHPRALHNC